MYAHKLSSHKSENKYHEPAMQKRSSVLERETSIWNFPEKIKISKKVKEEEVKHKI